MSESMHFPIYFCSCCCCENCKNSIVNRSSHCVAIVHSFIKKIATDSFELKIVAVANFLFFLFTSFIVHTEKNRLREKEANKKKDWSLRQLCIIAYWWDIEEKESSNNYIHLFHIAAVQFFDNFYKPISPFLFIISLFVSILSISLQRHFNKITMMDGSMRRFNHIDYSIFHSWQLQINR